MISFVAVAALVAGLAVPILVPSGASADSTTAGHNPRGKFLGVIPSRDVTSRVDKPASVARPAVMAPVTYHGGPVLHSSNVYAIFWKPAAFTIPTGYGAAIAKYFTDVAHDSFTAANPYGSDAQYYDVAGTVKQFVSYAVTYKTLVVDTHNFPANGCPNYALDDGTMSTTCLTNAQIANEVKSVIAAHSFPRGMTNEYFLFTPQRVATCFTAKALSTGGCYNPLNFPGFCAYHSFSGAAAQAVLYANMAFANVNGCSSGQSPGNNAADSTINVISHEHQETITDPLGTAWFDNTGNEIADKCIFTFGAPIGANAFGQFNEVINSDDYWLQEIWSNRARACVQRNGFPQPTASFTFAPAAPAHGVKVTFHSTSHSGDGTALKLHWTFPNGTVSTVANPTFIFTAAGAKAVSLLVFDTHGDQARVTRTITVH